jgi:hypothetical protein
MVENRLLKIDRRWPTIQIIDSDDGNAERTVMSYLTVFRNSFHYFFLFVLFVRLCYVQR